MIQYKEMPPSAQKSYDFNNKARKITMMIGWVASPIIFIAYFIGSIVEKDLDFVNSFLNGITFGCALNGLIHCVFLWKGGLKKLTEWAVSLGILLGLFALIPILLVVIGVPYLCAAFGYFFVAIDTILFLMKKPLIYKWEHKYLLKSKKAQEEIEEDAYRETMYAAESTAAAEQLSNLNKLKEQGAITEEEFNRKKAELLEKI